MHGLFRRVQPAVQQRREALGVDRRVEEHVFSSRDRGATWQDKIVAKTQPGLNCTAVGCTTDFYQGHAAISADATATCLPV